MDQPMSLEHLESRIVTQLSQLLGERASKIRLETEPNPYGDDDLSVVLDGDVSIAWQAEESCWVVDSIIYDPGVRYYHDGSGDPPSWNYFTTYAGPDLNAAIDQAAASWSEEQDGRHSGW